ncbi:DUF1990 domain-containing protein [Microlunatus elymi]|uniref:DUF1990 domain-containing protein n=1 Tax=Microlunatus elymi TaxID=2596828 RepID=A0A516PUC1_9ACTN|nr:DUF1990 domain-containing protein [Microlunatus elymi]QDP94777.1 DUF1990 domain-containing protein [Microlunatus elymi]
MAVVEALPAELVCELERAAYNYPEVGATRGDQFPGGYRALHESVTIRGGRKTFERLAGRLMTWRIHLDAGLRLQVSNPRPIESAVVIATLRLGPFPVRTRCRVVYVIKETNRVGFAYGTLPGHPERGEEQFLVELLDDDQVRFGLTAFSRNASVLALLGGPISNRVQLMVNHRYLDAARSARTG